MSTIEVILRDGEQPTARYIPEDCGDPGCCECNPITPDQVENAITAHGIMLAEMAAELRKMRRQMKRIKQRVEAFEALITFADDLPEI